MKLRLEQAERRCGELDERVKELTASKARQADLITKLEHDLLQRHVPSPCAC